LPLSLLDLISSVSGRPPRLYTEEALLAHGEEIEVRALSSPREAPLAVAGLGGDRITRAERDRWIRIARQSPVCVIAAPGLRDVTGRPGALDILRIPAGDPLTRDRLRLTIGGPRTAGILIARDADDPYGLRVQERLCEGLWSHDPVVVRAGAVWVSAYLRGHRPELADRWDEALDAVLSPGAAARRRGVARR
jgi:DICT domain-containing protein